MKASAHHKTYDPQSADPAFHIYESIKIVKAAQVTAVGNKPGTVFVGRDIMITFEPSNRPVPKVGDWCIMYPDGYVSFCPHDSFVGGYQLLGSQGEVIMPTAKDQHVTAAVREAKAG